MEKPKNATLKRKQSNKKFKRNNVQKRIKDKSNGSSSTSDSDDEPYI